MSQPAPDAMLTTSQPPARPPARGARTRRVSHSGLTWIDIVNPGRDEIAFLRQHYPFHSLTLDDLLAHAHSPRLDSFADAGYLFLALQFPVIDRERQAPVPARLDLFVGQGYLITLHDGQLKPISRMFNVLSVDEPARAQVMGRGPGYLLYRMLDGLMKSCAPLLQQLSRDLDDIEAVLLSPNPRPFAREVGLARRDIIALRAVLRPNLPVAQALVGVAATPLLDLDAAYFERVADGFTVLGAALDEQYETAVSYGETLDSLASVRIGEILKLLTVVSVLLLPLILIASLFAMNLVLPFAERPWAFAAVLGLMLASAGGALAYFRRNGWI